MIPNVDKDGDHPCFIYPVTTECEERVRFPILAPDGCVRITGGTSFDSEQIWFKDAVEKRRADG
jgi:hypothetical protein